MNWKHERGPQWKSGWSGQSLGSISAPSFHLLTIFAIVIFLLSSSRPTDYRTDTRSSSGLFSVLLLIAVISGGAYFVLNGGLSYHLQRLRYGATQRFTHQPPPPHFSSYRR